jgi:sugar lactone lactonase YvrE
MQRFKSAVSLIIIVLTACGTGSSSSPSPATPLPLDGLWTVSGSPAALLRLDNLQLADTGKQMPATAITTPSAGLETVSAMAFADDGTLWVVSQDDSLLLGFAPGTLSASGARSASVVISSNHGSLSGPTGLAFDRAGQLWVANPGNGTLVRYQPEQLTASGAPVPRVTLSGFSHPTGIAIDRVGGLWFTDRASNAVSRLTFGELSTTGTPFPTVGIQSVNNSLSGPSGLAIDSAGTLWVANGQNATVVGFAFEQLRDSGFTVPHVTITSSGPGSLFIPVGLAFDGSGALWVINIDGEIEKFTRNQLAASGAPVPAAHLRILGHALFWGAAFWPKPAGGLPLN